MKAMEMLEKGIVIVGKQYYADSFHEDLQVFSTAKARDEWTHAGEGTPGGREAYDRGTRIMLTGRRARIKYPYFFK